MDLFRKRRATMKKITLLLLIIFLSFISQIQNKTFLIDDFSVDTPPLSIFTTSTTTYPHAETAFTLSYPSPQLKSTICGEERDLEITIISSPEDRNYTTGVSDGNWNTSSNEGNVIYSCVYDGIDGSSHINTKGLSGMLLNEYIAMTIEYSTSLPVKLTITIYDMKDGVSIYYSEINSTSGIEGSSDLLSIPFTNFTGDANLKSVGAISISLENQGYNNNLMFPIIFLDDVLTRPSSSPSPSPNNNNNYEISSTSNSSENEEESSEIVTDIIFGTVIGVSFVFLVVICFGVISYKVFLWRKEKSLVSSHPYRRDRFNDFDDHFLL